MAYQALIILGIAASAASQYSSSSFTYGNSRYGNSISGSPLQDFSPNSYSSFSSPSAPSSSGTYAASAPLLAQSNYPYDARLQHLVYPSRGYDVTEPPQEPESPPSPIPPPSAPVAFPLPNLPPQVPPPPPLQPVPNILPGISGPGAQLSSHSTTSFSSPYVSYQH